MPDQSVDGADLVASVGFDDAAGVDACAGDIAGDITVDSGSDITGGSASPISLTAYRERRRDVSPADERRGTSPADERGVTDMAVTQAWTRILADIPREERLRYAGMAGDESHLIDILAFDPDPAVRRCVALHPGLTARGQWELVRDPDATIRERLARNVCAEPEILELLGRDLDLVVRRSVAANESTPEEVRRRLARDAQASVRTAARPARSRAR